MRVAGNFLYVLVCPADPGVQIALLAIFDLSAPAEPRLVGSCEFHSYVYEMDVAGDNVFVAGGRSGLLVIDVSDPAHPYLKATSPPTWYYCCVSVSGNSGAQLFPSVDKENRRSSSTLICRIAVGCMS